MARKAGSCFCFALLAGSLSLLAPACEIRFGYDDHRSCSECSLDNANPRCSNGECLINSCNSGFDDCDRIASNGCEVDLRSAWRNCGACGNICTNGSGCLDGSCERSTEVARAPLSTGGIVIAVDDTHVYWGHGADISGIYRATKPRGPLEPVATASRVSDLAVDNTHVYWLEYPGLSSPTQSRLRRALKDPTVAAPTELASIEGNADRHFVLQGRYLYLDITTSAGDSFMRVPAEGGPAELVPGWGRRGTLFGLQARGSNLVFGFSAVDAPNPMLVEYAPASGEISILDENFHAFVFALDDTSVYYEDTYSALGPTSSLITRRVLPDGSAQAIMIPRVRFESMLVDGGDLFLFDRFRGGLSKVDLETFTTSVVFGEQRNLSNFALDASFLYFVDGNRILSMAR